MFLIVTVMMMMMVKIMVLETTKTMPMLPIIRNDDEGSRRDNSDNVCLCR